MAREYKVHEPIVRRLRLAGQLASYGRVFENSAISLQRSADESESDEKRYLELHSVSDVRRNEWIDKFVPLQRPESSKLEL